MCVAQQWTNLGDKNAVHACHMLLGDKHAGRPHRHILDIMQTKGQGRCMPLEVCLCMDMCRKNSSNVSTMYIHKQNTLLGSGIPVS